MAFGTTALVLVHVAICLIGYYSLGGSMSSRRRYSCALLTVFGSDHTDLFLLVMMCQHRQVTTSAALQQMTYEGIKHWICTCKPFHSC
jgi:hypothetical protein